MEVSYSNAKEGAAGFDDTYQATGEATISVYKTVNGGTTAKPGERFTFELYKAGADGKATGEALGTVETEMGKVASFGALKLTEAGTYTYVVHETGHNSDGWTAASDVAATVTATDDGKGGLDVEVSYSNAKEGAAWFDNKYAQPDQPTEGTDQPRTEEKAAAKKSSGAKTGDDSIVLGGAAVAVAASAAGVAAMARRRKDS